MFNQKVIRLVHQLVLLELREKFNLMRNNEKLLVFERLDGDIKNWIILLTYNIAEAIRIDGALTCGDSAHLNYYVNATRINVW